MRDESEVCDACDGRRYLHIDYDSSGHPEIERCDACSYPELNDDDACILHRLYCGCGVPEISEGRVGQETQGRTMFDFPTFGEEYVRLHIKLGMLNLYVNQTRPSDEERFT